MHSQNKEEEYILKYFEGKTGTFLSLGENDGTTFSNVRALALLGWSGVCVEPSPRAFQKLKNLYDGNKNIFCYQVAIADHNGKGMLQESGPLCSAADVALVSTFHQSEMDRFKRTVTYEPVEVKTFRWKTFLNRLKFKKFDFISIDCEGNDLCILQQIDLTDTQCICLEWNSKPELKTAFEKYLGGFKLIYTSGENLIYGR